MPLLLLNSVGRHVRSSSWVCRRTFPVLFLSRHAGTVAIGNMKGTQKTKLIFYLCGILVVVRVAAHSDADLHIDKPAVMDSSGLDRQLLKKIEAFKRGGIEKEVNVSDYDVEGVIEYAESLLGTPHVMGGYSSSGLDCSGLVALAHAQFAVSLPRASHEQGRYGVLISRRDALKRGDLVFFHSTYKKSQLITHSGIYLGDNKFIHTSTSRGVSISTLFDSGYWEDHYLFATRLEE